MEFLIGGLSGALAVCVTNPLEVVKCRFQLQGELKARGQYAVHYKNIIHAFYTIAKNDGLFALQKGLPPAMAYQVVLGGCRLGLFQVAEDRKWIAKKGSNNSVGDTSLLKSMAISVAGGCVGGFMSTPFYLVKTRLQVKSSEAIAVGYQHRYKGTIGAFVDIYSNQGIKGLWRGYPLIMFRIAVASSSQIPTFTMLKQYLKNHEVSFEASFYASLRPNSSSRLSWMDMIEEHACVLAGIEFCFVNFLLPKLPNESAGCSKSTSHISAMMIETTVLPNFGGMSHTVVAAFGGGIVTALAITPVDVISTRFCNQGLDASGKGLLYKNGVDCAIKTLKKEGIFGLYKGLIPCYFRIGPYSILTMVLWDSLKSLQRKYNSSS